ncbi:hypothetical protein [Streptomyces sp. M-16]|uniref:hypothetical protein n=1 Tax=Streptomyces sp. M-16 TaxID=3233040 RepID=UPI003F998873
MLFRLMNGVVIKSPPPVVNRAATAIPWAQGDPVTYPSRATSAHGLTPLGQYGQRGPADLLAKWGAAYTAIDEDDDMLPSFGAGTVTLRFPADPDHASVYFPQVGGTFADRPAGEGLAELGRAGGGGLDDAVLIIAQQAGTASRPLRVRQAKPI